MVKEQQNDTAERFQLEQRSAVSEQNHAQPLSPYWVTISQVVTEDNYWQILRNISVMGTAQSQTFCCSLQQRAKFTAVIVTFEDH